MDIKKYLELKNELFTSLFYIFDEFINDFDLSKDYSKLIFKEFKNFSDKCNFNLDFEFSIYDFKIFDECKFSDDEWISIYRLFYRLFSQDSKLTPFIKLFYCDLLYKGPFEEDVEALDMSNNLLELMFDELKRLFWLFDEYFKDDNSKLISQIAEAGKCDVIPFFIVNHLAGWIYEHIENDSNKMREYGDVSLELYLIAFDKIFKKPIIYRWEEYIDLDSIRYDIDTSKFNKKQIEKVYSKIENLDLLFDYEKYLKIFYNKTYLIS